MASNYPQEMLKFAMDTVFPIRCIGCGLYDTYICESCFDGIKIKKDSEMVGKVQTFSAVSYGDVLVEKAIKTFKYGFIEDMAVPIFKIIGKYINSISGHLGLWDGNPLLVPIPLHRKRLNWRGFNQSRIIAEKIAAGFGFETDPDILIRTRDTQPQADIPDKDERLGNIKGAFRCTKALGGRNIIIVDDICTTGATLNECAEVLAVSGAGKIKALVIARG